MELAVGQCLIQLAKAEGAKCILATAGSDEKTKLCEELGATRGINYKTSDWGEQVKSLAPEGVDFIVDFIMGLYIPPIIRELILGQGYLEKDLQVCAGDATIVCLATLGGKIINNFDAGAILYKRLTVPPSSSSEY